MDGYAIFCVTLPHQRFDDLLMMKKRSILKTVQNSIFSGFKRHQLQPRQHPTHSHTRTPNLHYNLCFAPSFLVLPIAVNDVY